VLLGPQTRIETLLWKSDRFSTPTTSAGFLSATGITPTSLYNCREASGAAVDSVSGNNLAAIGSPKYQQPIGGKIGFKYDTAGAGHGSNVNDFASNSVIFGCVATIPSTPSAGLPGIIGRTFYTTFPEAMIYRASDAVKYATFTIRDSVSTLILSDNSLNLVDVQRPILYIGQIDRTNTTARFLIADTNKILTQRSGSIAGFGTLTGGSSPMFCFGAGTSFVAGPAVCYAFYATGAQCEGSTKLLNVARGLGFGDF